MCAPCLPAEVWTLVFRLLSLSDRLRVRASCKCFRDLVDNVLWRNRTVELRRRGEEYEEDFWSSLRRWRVTSVRLSSHIKLAHIAKELPGLTTLIIHDYKDEWSITHMQIQDIKSFSHLERLHLTLPTNVGMEELSPALPQRLTHLRVCQTNVGNFYLLPAEIPPDSPFKKLKSLVFHCMLDSHPVNVLHLFLSSLPQLQHLSLSVGTYTSFEGHISDLPPLHNCSLSSLELLECETKKFPMDFMKMLSKLPFLRSLAIFCQHDEDDEDDDDYYCYKDESDKLSAWLGDLPTLTSLTVECMYFGGFVGSIPSSVTCLTLWPCYMGSDDMTALSAQLPNLRHLILEVLVPCDPDMEDDDPPLGPRSEMELIPQLFPRLKTLRLLHDQVSDDVFLSLASLKELEVLEIMEVLDIVCVEPLPDALVSKLQELTNNRVRIYKKPKEQWQETCGCWDYIPTDDWE